MNMARISPKDYNTYEEYIAAGGKDDPIVKTMFGAKKNVANASAATDAPLASKKDVSMASKDNAVKPVIEAEKQVNEAKMKDARVPENQIAVREAENAMTKADQATDKAVTENMEKDEEIPPELEKQLFESDEGAAAKKAIEDNNPTELGSVSDENGDPVLPGHYDEAGNWVPYVKTEIPEYPMSRGTALALTLISVALSAISGGMLPPINFIKLRTDEQWQAEMKVNQDYADLVNGTAKERNTAQTDIEKVGKEYEQAQGMTSEGIDKMARRTGAAKGSSEQKGMELQEQLTKLGLQNAIDLKKLDMQQQKDMAELLYDQEINRIVNEIKTADGAGIDFDKLAQYRSSMAGNTKLQRALNYIEQGASAAGTVIRSVKGNSDKNVKKFSDSNTAMLRKHKLWR